MVQAYERAIAVLPEEWVFQNELGKALAKLGAPPGVYLQRFARACCYATVLMGGRAEPLYRLHASRLKLLHQVCGSCQVGDPVHQQSLLKGCP